MASSSLDPTDRAPHLASLGDLPMPATLLTADCVMLEANTAYCEAFGLELERIIGRSIFERADEETERVTRNYFARLSPSQSKLTTRPILQILHNRERRRIWQVTGLFDADGVLEKILILFWDVTEEYRYNETLEELIRITNDRSLDTDEVVEGILQIGHAFFRMTAGVISRCGPEGVTAEFQVRHDISPIGATVPLEYSYTSITHSRGSIVAIQDILKTPYADAPFHKRLNMRSFLSAEIHVDGKLYGALSFASPEARDIPFTDEDIQLIRILVQWLSYALMRRRRIAELRASEEKYRFIYQNSPIMMHTVDADMRITDVNKTWADTLGYSRKEVIGKPIANYLTEASKADLPDNIFDLIENPFVDVPFTTVRADGTLVEVEASTLVGSSSYPFTVLAVLNNVTDRNRAQRSLARLNEGLHRTNEGLKRFNAIAAHDLQEPLRKIRLFGDVLNEALSGIEDENVHHPLTVIQRSSERLTKLVNDLQTYTRETQRGVKRLPVDLNRLVSEALTSVAPPVEAGIEISDLPQVTGDPKSLSSLFNHLLGFALSGNGDEGPRILRIESRVLEQGGALILITDNGSRLPGTHGERIFEPFARRRPTRASADPIASEIGIGLAIAKSIVEGHGWQITASSNPDGAGTVFTIEIPAHQIIRRHIPAPAVVTDKADTPDQP
ncbi:PAS domain S-box protein [Breoghania sp.]|uniref:PAS domain-containing sensor histidine kinase n=1 Tax=Breoghania sp. TaxID=2065378 RepID=UPI002AA6602A|nr:PAS domain S-box protein [Breoghania sp.]